MNQKQIPITLNRVVNVSTDGSQGGTVYDSNGLAQAICACAHGYVMGYILVTLDE